MRRWYRGKEFPLPATTFEVAKVMGFMIVLKFYHRLPLTTIHKCPKKKKGRKERMCTSVYLEYHIEDCTKT